MSILSKQELINKARQFLLECNGYDSFCADIADALAKFEGKQLIETIQPTETKDIVINYIDHCLNNDKKRYKSKCVKFNKISDALVNGHMYPVIISVNNVCYAFESEAIWLNFREILISIYKIDTYSSCTINIYHITPPGAQRKAKLRYKSVDHSELQLVKKRISEIIGSSIDSIDISELSDQESCITLDDKIGTAEYVENLVTKICYKLLTGFKDDNPDHFKDITIGDSICQAEPVIVNKIRKGRYDDITISPITNIYTVINNNSNNTTINNPVQNIATDHSSMSVDGIHNTITETTVVKKKKKKTTEDRAHEWIESHPYKNTKTRGEYHKKYVKAMNKDDHKHLTIQQFAGLMCSLGFTEGGNTKNRIWVKDDSSGEEDNDDDESSSDDE